MKLFPAVALLVMVISLCGLTGDKSDTSNTNNKNGNTNAATAGGSSGTSDDDRHRLFQAAAATRDQNTVREVATKLGLTDANGNPNDKFSNFAKDHFVWVTKNQQFVSEVSDPAKARKYVEEHK